MCQKRAGNESRKIESGKSRKKNRDKEEWKWGKSEIKEVNEFSLPRFYFPKKWESKSTHKGKSEEGKKRREL